MTKIHPKPEMPPSQRATRVPEALACLVLALSAGLTLPAMAKDTVSDDQGEGAAKPAPAASAAKPIGDQILEALEGGAKANKRVTLVINGKEKKYITIPLAKREKPPDPPENEQNASLHKEDGPAVAPARKVVPVMHKTRPHQDTPLNWAYEGAGGPQAWGKLQPEFSLCTSGKRQSPINIDETQTLRGPAEAIQFHYQPSHATVRHDGHTIEVNVAGDNTLTVRGSTYKLVQLHFHHPAEERVNNQGFAMSVHLLHRNEQGKIVMLAVLLEPGEANALINNVWTYLPLEMGDQVPMPAGLLNLNELLPQDQRYYQFFGSLTTPPCTEDVLWLILKQTATASKEQIKLFAQLFPNNARPVQALNGRFVRNAQ